MSMEITKELIEKANNYVPMTAKINFAQAVAPRCIDTMNITAQRNGTEDMDMPSMYKENTERKQRYLLGALLKLYLNIEFDTEIEDDDFLITYSDYDEYAFSITKIERLKSDATIRDKCFDILIDYKMLEKLVNSECFGMINAMNDPITRLVSAMGFGGTPEELEKAMTQLQDVSTEIIDYKDKKLAELTEEENE